ncbi:DUF58 domain-containing protein [Spongiibacter sp. KMU-158]|uniref:DUF58 domain-containing protein n=1 Tax=Spongiibacter pelagi TaxID=2760804 RepID=A0A927C406_9GAMM|nr:DUF58 domain-containing protein [Spongiibacter pelagi]MBD2859060.1 DUF58 domain-containing protein [Spongiibacter pelagi]
MANPLSFLRAQAERRFNAWLARRSPPQRALSLNHSQTYIFPSKPGLLFLGMLLLILLLAINYQNNLVFALCFTLFSLFLVCILHTFANLSGLSLRAGAAEPVFAGEDAHFHLHLKSGARARYAVSLGFNGQESQIAEMAGANEELTIRLPFPTTQRGLLKPNRLRVRSDFPLGLLRCWSLPALDWQCLVYPQPRALRPLQTAESSGEEGGADRLHDGEQFSGFERYQPGESPRRIYWKAYAKGQELLSKHFEQSLSHELILDWESLPGLGTEDRLSTLCAWALECDQRGLGFGLSLPNQIIESGFGAAHLANVLAALAQFDPLKTANSTAGVS